MKIAILNWSIPADEIAVDQHARVVFGEGRDAITVMVRNGHVEVSGTGRIAIEPRAANVVRVVALL